MNSFPSTQDGKAEVQLRKSYPSSINCENTSAVPIDSYTDAFGNMYSSPMFTNPSNYDTSLASNSWSTEAAAALDLEFAGAIYSPPFPTHCVSVPFDASPSGIDPMASNGWQIDAEYLMQTSPGMPLRHASRAGSGSHNNITTASTISKADIWNLDTHKIENISHSNATTDESQYKHCADSLQPSPPHKRKKRGAAGSCQETSFKCRASALTNSPTYTTDPSKNPMPLAPDVSFDPPDADAHPNRRRPQSTRRAASSFDTQHSVLSPPEASRSEQRARSRTAANKCRVKTKAATAELEATEMAESARHQHLSTTLRGLQADVFALKSEILLHGNCGDGLIQDYLDNAARSLATGCGGATECGPGDASLNFSSTPMQLS